MAWLAPRSGGYSANGPNPDPRPAPPKGRGCASEPAPARLIPLGEGVYRITWPNMRSALTGRWRRRDGRPLS